MSITLALALPPAFGGASGSCYCHMVVGKAHLNTPPTKQVTESQVALRSLLEKRRERYHAKRRERYGGIPSENTIITKEGVRTTHEKRSVLCLESKLQSMKGHSDGVVHHPSGNLCVGYASITNPGSNLARLNCEELADRVVSKAKVRLKRHKRSRMANTFREVCKTPMNPSTPRLVGTSIIRASTPIPLHSKTSMPISRSPAVKKEHVIEPVNLLNLSLDSAGLAITNVNNKRGLKVKKVLVVYLSEKQSITSKDTGIPCVPPSSPQLECKQQRQPDSSLKINACQHNCMLAMMQDKGSIIMGKGSIIIMLMSHHLPFVTCIFPGSFWSC